LGIREIAYDHDFLHSAKGMPYQDVRNAIDLAFREHTTNTLKEIEFGQTTGVNGRYMDLTIITMPVELGGT